MSKETNSFWKYLKTQLTPNAFLLAKYSYSISNDELSQDQIQVKRLVKQYRLRWKKIKNIEVPKIG